MSDQPTAGRFDGREHILPVRIYYEDTDFTGLVYHGAYVRFFERGRSDFLRAAGIGHAELLDGERPLAFVVSRMTLEFVRPARMADPHAPRPPSSPPSSPGFRPCRLQGDDAGRPAR